VTYGYEASILRKLCDAILTAKDADALKTDQEKRYAQFAYTLIRAFATVGIYALIDEVTGYQEFRAKDDLSKILEAFVAKELQPWVKTFPDEYYKQLFRLRGLEYPKDTVKKPQYFGGITNEIIYKRLAPGVLEKLREVTPRNDNGRPSHKYFQSLTSNKGYPALRELLGSVVTMMALTDGWAKFIETLNKRHPKFNAQIALPLEYDANLDDGKGL
jgi:hypothetical protein